MTHRHEYLSDEMKEAATNPMHRHDWRVTVGDGIVGYCEAPFCKASIDWDEIERRLNACEALSAQKAKRNLDFIPEDEDLAYYKEQSEYASILEGKDGRQG